MMKRGWGSIGFAVATILLAVGLQWLRVGYIKEGDRTAVARPITLSEQLPASLAGWSGRNEPLGPNEQARTTVERILNYDDYTYRIYERGGRQIGLYVAYWAPGRMPLQKVASHTPDRCWTENGWHCLERRHSESVGTAAWALKPAQWRLFQSPQGAAAGKTYVLYWHLVGTQLYDYGERFNARPDIVKWWRDTLQYAFSGSDAQYFIRLTSNRPFEELAGDPGWEELLSALAKLGLEAPAAPKSPVDGNR